MLQAKLLAEFSKLPVEEQARLLAQSQKSISKPVGVKKTKREVIEAILSRKRRQIASPIRSIEPVRRILPASRNELPLEYWEALDVVHETYVSYKVSYNLTPDPRTYEIITEFNTRINVKKEWDQLVDEPWKFQYYYGTTIDEAVAQSAPLIMKFIDEYFQSTGADPVGMSSKVTMFLAADIYYLKGSVIRHHGKIEDDRHLVEHNNIFPYAHEPWSITHWKRKSLERKQNYIKDYLSRFTPRAVGVNGSEPVYDVLISRLKLMIESTQAKTSVGMTLDIDKKFLHRSCIKGF